MITMPIITRKGNLRKMIKFRKFLLKSRDPLVFLIRRQVGGKKNIKRRLEDNIRTLKKLGSKRKRKKRR